MSRIERWDYGASCPRWRKMEGAPKTLPLTVTQAELDDLPHPDDEWYEECDGTVRVKGYYDPGSMYGGMDNLGSAPEGDNEAYPCSACGNDDWTDDEMERFENEGRDDL